MGKKEQNLFNHLAKTTEEMSNKSGMKVHCYLEAVQEFFAQQHILTACTSTDLEVGCLQMHFNVNQKKAQPVKKYKS